MKKISKELLIPFDIFLKGQSKDFQKATRRRLNSSNLLVKKKGQEFISLSGYFNTYSENGEKMRKRDKKCQQFEDIVAEELLLQFILYDWQKFCNIILSMNAGIIDNPSKIDLKEAFDCAITELKNIYEKNISIKEQLFQLNAPSVAIEFVEEGIKHLEEEGNF